MSVLYKLKIFFKPFFIWNKKREIAFFIDEQLVCLDYVLSFKCTDIYKIFENRFLDNVEGVITRHIKGLDILEIISKKEMIIELINKELEAFIKTSKFSIINIKLTNLRIPMNAKKFNICSKDGIKVNVFIYYDEGVVDLGYLTEAINYVSNNVEKFDMENMSYALHNAEILFPKLDICLEV